MSTNNDKIKYWSGVIHLGDLELLFCFFLRRSQNQIISWSLYCWPINSFLDFIFFCDCLFSYEKCITKYECVNMFQKRKCSLFLSCTYLISVLCSAESGYLGVYVLGSLSIKTSFSALSPKFYQKNMYEKTSFFHIHKNYVSVIIVKRYSTLITSRIIDTL